METRTLCIAATLSASPGEVFAVLTDAARHSAMTRAESRIEPKAGGRFSFFNGDVSGTMRELKPATRIVQELRAAEWPEGHHATVTYSLTPQSEGARTHVWVEEQGVPADQVAGVRDGWQQYWSLFADYLREAKVEVVRGFIEAYKNHQDADSVDRYVSEDCALHLPLLQLPPGREGMRLNGRIICGAFPDVHAEREFFVTEGDIVIERAHVRATHAGELAGIPASGKPVTWTELHAYRIANGLISEIWSEADLLGVMAQIGVMELPAS